MYGRRRRRESLDNLEFCYWKHGTPKNMNEVTPELAAYTEHMKSNDLLQRWSVVRYLGAWYESNLHLGVSSKIVVKAGTPL